jgi:hypothetical protein
MTASLQEPRRGPEACGRSAAGVRALRGCPGSAGLPGWAVPVLPGRVAAGQFTAVVTKSALILPCLAVAAGMAAAWYAAPYPEEDLMNVEISGVARRFGRNLAVAGVGVETGPGVFGLLGPNGAGKSAAKRVFRGEKEGVA